MPETLPLPCPVLSIGDARVTSVGNVANTSWWHMFGLPKKINHMKTHIARIFLAACTCLFFFISLLNIWFHVTTRWCLGLYKHTDPILPLLHGHDQY